VRAIPGYKLLAIGRGDIPKLRALAQDDPSIVFTGRVDSVVPEIRKAEVCIAPLISGAGLRGKINQYTTCGRPTVSTTIGAAGMPYVNGQSILIADQPKEFSKHMIELLRNETLRMKITAQAKKVLEEHFCWKRNIQQLETIFYDC
jgi:glycosyltransferase involved in cell wall biosynthesis